MKTFKASLLIVCLSLATVLSGCAALNLFAPEKVEQALIKIQLKYSGLLDVATEHRQSGVLSDSMAQKMNRLFIKFDAAYGTVTSEVDAAEDEADNLDKIIKFQLQTPGLSSLNERYLALRERAESRAESTDVNGLKQLEVENLIKRQAWDKLL